MWEIKNLTIQKTKLDFTSSEQGFLEVSQLIAEGVVLMNAIELMEFDEDIIQVLICDHCGTVGCQSGNWVSFRKSGNYILLIPAFEEMEDNWSKTEYSPPKYFKKEGTPYFTFQVYESLIMEFSRFPRINEIKNLKMSEAMRLAQYKMPLRIFGEPPEISLQRDKIKYIVASSEGEPETHLQNIEEILRQNYKSSSSAKIRYPLPDEETIYLFIDIAEFTDWKALVKSNSNYRLFLEEEFVVEEEIH